MTPEQMVYAEEVLFSSGALDVFRTPIVMKKGRSAFQLSVLCKAQDLERMQEIIVTQTSSIGMRMFSVEKFALERQFEEVETPLGRVMLKRAYYHGKLVNQKPEYEDCKRIAIEKKIPIKEVYETLSGWLWRER